MVAYSFKGRFREPILAGSKRQTIRAERKRHAREGEAVQLYTGMRTRQCSLIGRAVCASVLPVTIGVLAGYVTMPAACWKAGEDGGRLDAFAQADGFADWAEMAAFWRAEHPGVPVFTGVLVEWKDLVP